MSRPQTKPELLDAMEKEHSRLMTSVDAVPVGERALPGACEEWSVKDILAHLDAWHRMFLTWHELGSHGGKPDMPATGYGWGETPELNHAIWEEARTDRWDDVVKRLDTSFDEVRAVIEAYPPDELFEKKRHAWTGSTSVGSYATSATSAHYVWATKLIRAFSGSRVGAELHRSER